MSTRAPLQIHRSGGPTHEHSYIVKLRADADKQAHFNHIAEHIAPLDGLSEVTHPDWSSACFHGYAGKFSDASLDNLLRRTDIEYVAEDAAIFEDAIDTETNAPWGLARICQKDKLVGSASSLTYSYSYDSTAGKGVDIYVVDTGIYIEHHDFEGRATWGITVAGEDKVDKVGHGTHCAGIAAGRKFGVAKAAHLIAVKIMPDTGRHGSTTDAVTGLDWVIKTAAGTGRPSVVSMSIGAPSTDNNPINDSVGNLTAAGIHFVCSAGNKHKDASAQSPANAPTALTVGATTIEDARWSGSNYGPCVDVFAPGKDIISCGIKGLDSTATMTGTSMATPHVSGLVAYFIGKNGNLKPDDMADNIKSLSLKDILTNIPADTANLLIQNNDHFIADGVYTISYVKTPEDLVRVEKPKSEGQNQKHGNGQSQSLLPQGKGDGADKESSLFVEVCVDTKDINAYEQLTGKRTRMSVCMILFTDKDDKSFYWGLDSAYEQTVGAKVQLFDPYSPEYHWYITLIPVDAGKKGDDAHDGKVPSTH